MIVVAVEHAGIERFVQEEIATDAEYEAVQIVHSWEEVKRIAHRAHRVLLGERIVRYVPEEEIKKLTRQETVTQWVLWITEERSWRSLLGDNVQLWHKELSPEDLKSWLKPISGRTRVRLPSRWFLWSTSGTIHRLETWKSLIARMNDQYEEGVVVDFDWEQALVTRLGKLPSLRDENYPYARLEVHAAPWGQLVPAPMPWMPVLYAPDTNDVKRTLAHSSQWMVWDLGTNVRDPLTSFIIASLPSGLIYIGEGEHNDFLHHGLALIKDLNPHCELLVVGEQAQFAADRYGLPFLPSGPLPLPNAKTKSSRAVLTRWIDRYQRKRRSRRSESE